MPRPGFLSTGFCRALRVVCVAALGCFWALPARANGRFPGASQVVFQPGQVTHLVARTTFGFLVSEDAGQRFHWVCEEIVGYTGQQDPAIALFGDGTLATAALEGAFVSQDGGCSHARLTDLTSVDSTVSRGNPSKGLLLASGFVGGTHIGRILATENDGHGFVPRADLESSFYPDTIDIAPSSESRVYLSGTFATAAALAGAVDRSDDGGATFTRQPFDLQGDAGVYIAAVDPVDADVVYVRTTGKTEDRLLVSKDGGKTFETIASVPGGLLGFALSPDGSSIAIGGPDIGVQVAPRETRVFAQRNAAAVSCLAWSSAGLFACGAGAAAPFVLARSVDGGATFAPLLSTLNDICGPLPGCTVESSFQSVCRPRWPGIAATFGGDGIDRCGGGAGAAGGGSSGAAGAAGASAGGAGGAEPTAPKGATKDGCALVGGASPRPATPVSWLALPAALVGLLRRSRRDVARSESLAGRRALPREQRVQEPRRGQAEAVGGHGLRAARRRIMR